MTNERPDVLVIFGITGDVAKVMTFRSLYRLERRALLDCPIIGVAVDDWTRDDLVDYARSSIVGTGEHLDEVVFARLADRLSYVLGDCTDPATYDRLAAAVGEVHAPVFYLDIPATLFTTVVRRLHGVGLAAAGRFMVEKPFGYRYEPCAAPDGPASSTGFVPVYPIDTSMRSPQPSASTGPADMRPHHITATTRSRVSRSRQ